MNNPGLHAGEKILLVGNPDAVHVGAHLANAAKSLGLRVMFSDSTEAYAGPTWLVKLNWYLRQHRPTRLREFSQQVVQTCRELRPKWMLTTGLAPIESSALREIEKIGVRRINFLTDDPWNPAHQTSWFMKALPLYDDVFSPRRANLADLRQLGCSSVSYLPFAYAPELHFPEPPTAPTECEQFAADITFAGAADADRIGCMAALIESNFKIDLYGGYWNRHSVTKTFWRGYADPQTLRKAIGGAKVALCLVRRANRDGHAMRSFEVPAIGACMLVEDTEEHRAIFGKDGEAATYFSSIDEMVEKLRWLLESERERQMMAHAAHQLITEGKHTYRERLITMLGKGDE